MSRKMMGPNRFSASTTYLTSWVNKDERSLLLRVQLGDDAGFFIAFQFDDHVLLCGEVEVEGAPRHACRRDDRADVCSRQTGALDLGHRRVEQSGPGFEPLRFAYPGRRHYRDRMPFG